MKARTEEPVVIRRGRLNKAERRRLEQLVVAEEDRDLARKGWHEEAKRLEGARDKLQAQVYALEDERQRLVLKLDAALVAMVGFQGEVRRLVQADKARDRDRQSLTMQFQHDAEKGWRAVNTAAVRDFATAVDRDMVAVAR